MFFPETITNLNWYLWSIPNKISPDGWIYFNYTYISYYLFYYICVIFSSHIYLSDFLGLKYFYIYITDAVKGKHQRIHKIFILSVSSNRIGSVEILCLWETNQNWIYLFTQLTTTSRNVILSGSVWYNLSCVS